MFVGVMICLAPAYAVEPTRVDSGPDDEAATETRADLYEQVAAETAALQRQGALLKRMIKLVRPTVVHIEAYRGEKRDNKGRVEEAGSGVVITLNERHYVITNRHVIKDATSNNIKIKLADGRLIYPTKVWSDPGTDVAVLAVKAPRLVAARLGDSQETDIGDFVLAVGSPFGLSHSVTFGIVSAKGRRDLELGDDGVRFQDFMQTDAAINPGNSGGPLLNLRGEVVAINTAIASSSGGSEGIGFSIPIHVVMNVATQLIESGRVSRAFLGVQLDASFTAEMATKLGMPRAEGARVKEITPRSPAEEAGIRPGDIIIQYDATRIEDDSHLINLVSLTPVATQTTLVVFRAGRLHTLEVTVGDRGESDP